MGPSHGGLHRSLEIMKEMIRTGRPPERDPVETWAPWVALAIAGAVIVGVLVVRLT